MKKLVLFSLVLQLAFFVACNQDDDCNSPGEIIGKWQAKDFLSVESRGYAKNDDYEPVIVFKEDGTYGLKLDANSCFGEFSYEREGINISDAYCTMVCCDSDFSGKFVEMLPQVQSYSIEDNILKLSVSAWGWIELERMSD